MCPSEREMFHTFHTAEKRYGTREALGEKGVPYLPYLPYLFSHVRVGACRRMHRPVRPRARALLTYFRYGRYGRYGRGPQDKGSRVPYLFHTSARYGR